MTAYTKRHSEYRDDDFQKGPLIINLLCPNVFVWVAKNSMCYFSHTGNGCLSYWYDDGHSKHYKSIMN